MRTVVVVEGPSDQVAVEALAERRGIDLPAAGVQIVQLGGAHRIGRFLAELGDGIKVVGLCDAAEEPVFRKALEGTGFAFDVCVEDLEDELIRALGAPAVVDVVRDTGDLRRFGALQQMPEWRGARTEDQLRRFIAAGAGRKIRYARLLIEALADESVPRPLDRVLARAVDQ
jgi:hypothetical protein